MEKTEIGDGDKTYWNGPSKRDRCLTIL